MRWFLLLVSLTACSAKPEMPPALDDELRRGRATIEALSGRIASLENAVKRVSAMGPCIAVAATPSPTAVARIRIDTAPSGAAVFVDGQQVGISPVELTAPGSTFELRLELTGYASETRTVDGSKDARLSVNLEPR